jgi:L-seryl-tRNA(Ser) seleniumtransferase
MRHTPIIARIFHDTLLLDPRTVLEEQDEELLKALVEEIGSNP